MTTTSAQNQYALLIGANYTDVPMNTLRGCAEDIINVRNILIDAYGYNPNNIVMLRDDMNDPSKLPTRANILQQMTAIVQNSANSGCKQIWIHYSGHGLDILDENGNMVPSIVPIDYEKTGFITNREIFGIIQNIGCTAFLFFDCCYSGLICDLEWSFQFQSNLSFSRIQNNHLTIANPNIFMMSGCKDNQTSAEAFDTMEQEFVGAFTDALIDALRDSNHNITLLNLYRNVCTYLASRGFSQVPVLSSSGQTPNYTFSRNTIVTIVNTI
jgi:hypothetical protein